MSDSVSAAPAGASRSRSPTAQRAERRNEAEHEMRLSNGGASIADIAAREDEKRMRALLRGSLAHRLCEPPVVALEVSRLNEALPMSYGPRSGADLQAVDRGPPRPDTSLGPGRCAPPRRRSRFISRQPVARKWRRKALKNLDSRKEMAPRFFRVTPVKTGVQIASHRPLEGDRAHTPTFAGFAGSPFSRG